MRGQLTLMIQQIAKDRIHREITTTELRLIPYIQYVMLNGQRIEPQKINQEERKILQIWKKAGWIEGGASGLSITKEFYDFMCEVLWEGYVVGGATDAWTAVKSAQAKGDYDLSNEPTFEDDRSERE